MYFFDVFFDNLLEGTFFHFECQTGSPKHPFGDHFGDFLVSGWKRENDVFVLVLARFRRLEGDQDSQNFCFFFQFAFQEAPGRHFLAIFAISGAIWAPLGRQFWDFFRIFWACQKKTDF